MTEDADVRLFALKKRSPVLRELPAFAQHMTNGDAAACQFDYGLGLGNGDRLLFKSLRQRYAVLKVAVPVSGGLTELALLGSPGLPLFDCHHLLHANIQRIGHFLKTLNGYPFVSGALVALDMLFWKIELLAELFLRPVSCDTRPNENTQYGLAVAHPLLGRYRPAT
jgi:hypothetical protein